MRGADSAVAARGLVELVQVYVIGQHQLSTLGNPQAIQRDAALGQLVHLVQERLRINDGTTADEARHARLEDAGRDEVEFEDSVLVDNGMAGIVTALKADDKVGLLGKEVNNASLAFISPLSTDNRRDRHIHSFYRVLAPVLAPENVAVSAADNKPESAPVGAGRKGIARCGDLGFRGRWENPGGALGRRARNLGRARGTVAAPAPRRGPAPPAAGRGSDARTGW